MRDVACGPIRSSRRGRRRSQRGARATSGEAVAWGTNPWFRIRVLKDVARGPNVETGASVPGYSGGLTAWKVLAQTVNPFVKYWRARHFPRAADTKPPRRRPSRHCSWVRWPRLAQLAYKPHPSSSVHECTNSHPGPQLHRMWRARQSFTNGLTV